MVYLWQPAFTLFFYSVYFKRSTLFTFSFNAQLYIKNGYTDEVREHCNYLNEKYDFQT